MDHFDVDGAIDDLGGGAAIWERQSQDYYGRLQKDDLLLPDFIAKDFDGWNETLQAKRRRRLQFSSENVETTRPMTEEGGHSQSPLNLNRLNRNTHVVPAMEKAVEISAEHAQARPAVLKDVSNTCPCKYIVTLPSEFRKPCNFLSETTLKDINEMIKASRKNDEEPNSYQSSAIYGGKPMVHKRRIHAPPPYKIKHGNDKECNSFQQVSAISEKPMVAKIRICTKGNKTISISRIIG